MGRRASGIIKERKHIHLTEGRWDRLTDLYKPQGISPSEVIDKLVGFHLKRIDEKINLKAGRAPAAQEVEEDIDMDGVSGDD